MRPIWSIQGHNDHCSSHWEQGWLARPHGRFWKRVLEEYAVDTAQGSTKRPAPEGTPDREAQARTKAQASDLMPRMLPTEEQDHVSKVEMSAATIATLRALMREEISIGMSALESRLTNKMDDQFIQMKQDLEQEGSARTMLEERVAQLESKQATKANTNDVTDAVGGFGETTVEEAEKLAHDLLKHVHGFHEVSMADGNSIVALLSVILLHMPWSLSDHWKRTFKYKQTNYGWQKTVAHGEKPGQKLPANSKIFDWAGKHSAQRCHCQLHGVQGSLSVTTASWCPSLLWRTTWLSIGMMPAMCRQWCEKQCKISLQTWSTDCTTVVFLIKENCNREWWWQNLQSPSWAFFANKWIFLSRNVSIRNKIEILQCHRDTNRLFWSWAPMHPQCRYGQTWNQLSTYDPEGGWSSRRDLLGGSVARNFAYLESTCARSRRSISHENMGKNLRFWTLGICLPYHMNLPHERWARRLLH